MFTYFKDYAFIQILVQNEKNYNETFITVFSIVIIEDKMLPKLFAYSYNCWYTHS